MASVPPRITNKQIVNTALAHAAARSGEVTAIHEDLAVAEASAQLARSALARHESGGELGDEELQELQAMVKAGEPLPAWGEQYDELLLQGTQDDDERVAADKLIKGIKRACDQIATLHTKHRALLADSEEPTDEDAGE